MSEVDKLVDLRDKVNVASKSLQLLSDAIQAYLGDLPPPIEESKQRWDPSKIVWNEVEGPSGSYDRSEDINNIQFKHMLKDLGEHNGKLTRDGIFYWVFQNGYTVGRKKAKY